MAPRERQPEPYRPEEAPRFGTAVLDRSYFSTGVSALFEMSTADAQRLLPPHLQPIELRPQRSILNITIFHFRRSEVGPYAELMFSVVVPPLIGALAHHPKAGFFPFLAATSSPESRLHRTRVLRIPHYPMDIDVQFIERPDEMRARVWGGGEAVVDLTVTQHQWRSSTHLLHTFMMDGSRRLKADLQISGRYTVHEQERGRLALFPHEMTRGLCLEDVTPYPFREHWLKEGCELFHGVQTI